MKIENPNPYVLHLATRKKRLLNGIIDLALLYISINSFSMLFVFFARWMEQPAWEHVIEDSSLVQKSLFVLVFAFLYYWLPEWYWSRSLAKLITTTLVVTKSGKKPGAVAILIRTLCRFIPFECFSFLNNQPIGWHDTLSNTYVIQKDRSLS
jgi:hypothetical protein